MGLGMSAYVGFLEVLFSASALYHWTPNDFPWVAATEWIAKTSWHRLHLLLRSQKTLFSHHLGQHQPQSPPSCRWYKQTMVSQDNAVECLTEGAEKHLRGHLLHGFVILARKISTVNFVEIHQSLGPLWTRRNFGGWWHCIFIWWWGGGCNFF